MRKSSTWKFALAAAGALALAARAQAQASGGGTAGGSSSSSSSTSPGVTDRNGSMTGVAVPGVAPVDPRTHEPAEPGTGATRDEREGSMAAASPPLTDLSGTGSSAGGTGSSADTARAPSSKVKDGLQELHAANQGEIQGGQLAAASASSPDVKAFGQQMVDDHTQNDQQLTQLAQTLDVGLTGRSFDKETKADQKAMKAFEGKTGSAFDQAYVSAMVKDHEKDAKTVKKLAEQARKDGQAELASFLDQTEQTMQTHLDHARSLQSSLRSTASSSAATSGGTGSTGTSP